MTETWSPEHDSVLLLLGTKKGAFILESDRSRKDWRVHGPYLEGWGVMHILLDPRDQQSLYAATDTVVWGGSMFRSEDFGASWAYETPGPRFPEGAGQTIIKPWQVQPGPSDDPGVLYAGVEPAALFRSPDGGKTWNRLDGLENHHSRKDWQPGNGGLCLHSIVLDPQNNQRLYVAISAAGVFRSDDGGATWAAKNVGIRDDFLPVQYPEWGQCIHKIAMHPEKPQTLYQQSHCGVYRSDDHGDSWTDIGAGRLPTDFGFPMVVHPHEPDTIYVVPEESPEKHWVPGGSMKVYRSRNRGEDWTPLSTGLPQENAYVGVLRDAMATDT